MKTLILIFTLFLSGCLLTTDRMNAAKDLTPEQIKALNEAGHSVFSCIIIGGPPVGGRTLFLIIPNNRLSTVNLSPDCQLQGATVGLATGQRQ